MNRRQKIRDPFRKSTGVNYILNVIMLIGFLGAAAQIIATVMHSWRVADAIVYPYLYRGNEEKYFVNVTRYGLYKVSFDEDRVFETWTQRVENMKVYGAVAAQQGLSDESSGTLSLFTSSCPQACRTAINTRISAYERISLISLVFLCSLVISSSVILLTLGWSILFSKSVFILMGAFVVSLVLNATAGGYWYYETDKTWNLIIKAQQFPFPRCSHSFFIFLASTAAFGLGFVLLLLADVIAKFQQRREKGNQLRMRNNMNPVMNPPPMMYPVMMYNNDQNNMMQRSASFSNPMPYTKSTNFDYPNYMQQAVGGFPMNFQNSFLNNPAPPGQPEFYQPLTRNFSYSAGMNPTTYPPNTFDPYNQGMYPGNFGPLPSKNDMDFARNYSGMNYINSPYGPASSFRF